MSYSIGEDGFVRFTCAGCGGKAKADPKHAGHSVKCPACGATMLVPGTMYMEPEHDDEPVGEVIEPPPLIDQGEPPPVLPGQTVTEPENDTVQMVGEWYQPYNRPAVNIFINNSRLGNPKMASAALVGGGVGVVIGATIGCIASQYFPFFGGFFAHIAEPFSPYRLELLPTHVIVCGLFAGAIGAAIAAGISASSSR